MTVTIEPPDFEDMMEVAERIRNLSLKEMVLKDTLKKKESEIYIEAITTDKHLVNGKPPSAVFVENAWKHTGFDGELLEIRNELATVSADLDHQKNIFGIRKDMLEIWRTESANKRASVL